MVVTGMEGLHPLFAGPEVYPAYAAHGVQAMHSGERAGVAARSRALSGAGGGGAVPARLLPPPATHCPQPLPPRPQARCRCWSACSKLSVRLRLVTRCGRGRARGAAACCPGPVAALLPHAGGPSALKPNRNSPRHDTHRCTHRWCLCPTTPKAWHCATRPAPGMACGYSSWVQVAGPAHGARHGASARHAHAYTLPPPRRCASRTSGRLCHSQETWTHASARCASAGGCVCSLQLLPRPQRRACGSPAERTLTLAAHAAPPVGTGGHLQRAGAPLLCAAAVLQGCVGRGPAGPGLGDVPGRRPPAMPAGLPCVCPPLCVPQPAGAG